MTTAQKTIRVDIVSDVVCPWCIVGYRQLAKAAEATGVKLDVHWHPFELNTNMPAEGQNLREHIMEKYGSSKEESDQARARLTGIGTELGFSFNFDEDSRMVNTFQAHQLINWADGLGRGHHVKMALFTAYFTAGADVSKIDVLLDVVADLGLDVVAAKIALGDADNAESVRAKQRFWLDQGIQGVPAMVFNQRHLVTGAQGEENYKNVLSQLVEMQEQEAATLA